MITPLIKKCTGEFLALENTEIDFLKSPAPAALYLTSIIPFSPGKMGFLGHFGLVHPQLTITLFIIRSVFDVFRNSNKHLFTLPLGMAPKLKVVRLKSI